MQTLYYVAYALTFSLTMLPQLGSFALTYQINYIGIYALLLLALYEAFFVRQTQLGQAPVETASQSPNSI